MIVDAHVHVFLSQEEDPERSVDAIAPADRCAPADELEAAMAEAGVDRAVLVPLGPEDGYVAGVRGQHPGRFAAVAVARDGQFDPGEVTERLDRGGFGGLRIFDLPGDPDDAPWMPLLTRLAADGRVLWAYPPADQLDTLDAIVARLPELRILLNHSGFTQSGIGVDDRGRPRIDTPVPQPSEPRMLALAAHPNIWVMASGAYAFSHQAYPYPDVTPITRRLADAYGTDRLVWASDFPWIVDDPGYTACLELVDHHLPGLSGTEREAILGGNALRLLEGWF